MSDQSAWDDTDLVAEWNAAKQEYQKYHSYAARGELIPPEDLAILNQDETNTTQPTNITKDISTKTIDVKATNDAHEQAFYQSRNDKDAFATNTGEPTTANGHLLPVPDAMMSNIQDDDLKKLLMSWYYSGYYTGRYEGKQEAYAEVRARYETSLAKNTKSRSKD